MNRHHTFYYLAVGTSAGETSTQENFDIMKTIVLLLASMCACAMSAPGAAGPQLAQVQARRTLPALQHEEVHDSLGQYALRYVTAEGTVVSERGRLVPGPEGYVLVYEGETTYIGDDGKTYVTKYSAGLDGYQVEGDHIPKAPEPVQA